MSPANHGESGASTQNKELGESNPGERIVSTGCLDRVLLIAVALIVCVTGGAAFWFAEDYRINPAWVFVAWNSILMVPLFIRDFRDHLKNSSFVAYLVAWAVIHGLLVTTLMRWLSIAAMLPFLAIELIAGLLAADYFFDIQPEQKEKK